MIAICLVILGHLKISQELYYFIYSFHMPFFFFISGLLFQNSLSFKETLKKYFHKLLIPYFWFSLISFFTLPMIPSILEILHNKNSFYQLLLLGSNLFIGILYGSITSLGSTWNVILWFIPCLFSIILIFKVLNKIDTKFLLPSLLLLQLSVPFINSIINPSMPFKSLPFGLDSALIGILYFAVGYNLKNYKLTFNNKYLSLLISMVLLTLVYFLSTTYKTSFDIGNNIQGNNPFIAYIISFTGISGVLFLSGFLEKIFHRLLLVEYISNNTLYIFSFQFIVIWNLHRVGLFFPKIISQLEWSIIIYCIIILIISLILKMFVQKIFKILYHFTTLRIFLHI